MARQSIEAWPMVSPEDIRISPDVQKERDQRALGILQTEYSQEADPAVQVALQKEIDAMSSGRSLTGKKLSWNKSGNESINSGSIEATPMEMEESGSIEATPMEMPKSDVGFGSSALQGLASGVGGMASTLLQGGAGIVNKISEFAGADPGVADPLMAYGDRISEAANNLFVKEEDQANAPLSNKIVQGLTSAVPALLTGPGAIPTLAATGTFEGGKAALKGGATLGQAQGIGAVEGAVNTAFGLVPPLFKSPIKAGLGAGTVNTLGGTLSDTFITNVILDKDQKHLKEMYNPLDLEKRVVEMATGVGYGYAQKKYQNYAEGKWAKDATESIQKLTGNMDGALVKAFQNPVTSTLQNGEVANTTALGKRIAAEAPIKDGLEIISKAVDADPHYKSLAEALHGWANAIGLDTVSVTDQVYNRNGRKFYDAFSDQVSLPSRMKSPEIYRAYLHEVIHALTSGSIHFYDSNPKGAPTRSQLIGGAKAWTDTQHAIWKRVDNLYKINKLAEQALDAELRKTTDQNPFFEKLRTEAWIDTKNGALNVGHDSMESIRKRYEQIRAEEDSGRPVPAHQQAINNEFKSMMYGFRNIREFASEALTNKRFQELLAQFKLDPDVALSLRPKGYSRMTNLWNAFKQTMKELILTGKKAGKQTILDAAVDSVLDIGMNTTPAMRAYARGDTRIVSSRLNKTETTLWGTRAKEKGLKEAEKAQHEASVVKDSENWSPVVKFYFQRTAFLRKTAATKAEFINRLRDEIPDEHWVDNFVSKWGDTLWENPHVIEAIGGKASDVKGVASLFTRFNPDLDEFMKKWNEDFGVKALSEDGVVVKPLERSDDLKELGRDVATSNTLRILKGDTPAGAILKWVHDRVSEYRIIKDVAYKRGQAYMKDFKALTTKDQVDLMAVIAKNQDFRTRKMLKDNDLMWMTDTMLRGEGMNDAQIKAYQSIAKSMDYFWSLLQQARIKMGMEPVEQIPNYMPHLWEGPYKVFVKEITATPNPMSKSSPPIITEKIVQLKTFRTKWMADHYAKTIDGQKAGTNVTLGIEPDPLTKKRFHVGKYEDLSGTLSGTIQEHLSTYQNQMLMNPDTMIAIQKIENDAMRGFSKHLLENTNVDGWIGQEAKKWGESRWNNLNMLSGDQKKSLDLYNKYAKSMSEMYANTLFMHEVISPLRDVFPDINSGRNYYGRLLAETPKLNEAITNFALNFTGENVNKMKWADKFLQNASVVIGIDPLGYRKGIRHMKNMVSTTFLVGNPKNLAANYFQFVTLGSNLQLMSSMLKAEARKNGKTISLSNPWAVMTDIATRMERGNLTEDQRQALMWARTRHITEALLTAEVTGSRGDDSPDSGWNPRRWSTEVEQAGREKVFLMAYEWLGKVYKDEGQRREAAANMVEMTMYNYDRSERPLMYQNYGIGGEFISPFATFRNAYIGNTYLALKHLAKNAKHIDGWAPIATMLAVSVGMAGASGMIIASEYDFIAKFINDNFNDIHMPRLSELLVDSKLPNALVYGLPSVAVGANIGSSMNAPGFDDMLSLALPGFINSLSGMAMWAGKAFGSSVGLTDTPPIKDAVKAGKGLLPPVLRPSLDVLATGGNTEMRINPNTMAATTTRTPQEYAAESFWGGAPSLEAVKAQSIIGLDVETERYNKRVSGRIIQRMVDKANGLPQSMTYSEAFEQWTNITGGSKEDFDKAIVAGLEDQQLTYKQRLEKKEKTFDIMKRLDKIYGRENK